MNDLRVMDAIRAGLADEEAVEDLAEAPALPATPSIPPELAELVARRQRLAAEAREASRLLARTRHRVDQYQAAQASTDTEIVFLLTEDLGLAQRIDPETGRASTVVVALGATVLSLVFLYGDSPRPTVDRLNLFLAPIVAVQFAIVVPAIWRLRRARTKPYRDVEL